MDHIPVFKLTLTPLLVLVCMLIMLITRRWGAFAGGNVPLSLKV